LADQALIERDGKDRRPSVLGDQRNLPSFGFLQEVARPIAQIPNGKYIDLVHGLSSKFAPTNRSTVYRSSLRKRRSIRE
jgi:hypothetical protein